MSQACQINRWRFTLVCKNRLWFNLYVSRQVCHAQVMVEVRWLKQAKKEKEKKKEEWNRRRLIQTPCNWNFLKFISYWRFRAWGLSHHRNEPTTPWMVCLQASNITTKRIKKRERFKTDLLPYSQTANCNLQNVMSTNFAWFGKYFSWLVSVFAWQANGANSALWALTEIPGNYENLHVILKWSVFA